MPKTYKSENRIQQEAVIAFHNKYPNLRGCLFHVPNGGMSAQHGKLLKQIGVVAGVSDLIFLYDGTATLFETKNKYGKQQPVQENWQRLMEKQGFKYYVYRSKELFMEIIKNIIDENK